VNELTRFEVSIHRILPNVGEAFDELRNTTNQMVKTLLLPQVAATAKQLV